MLSGRPLYANRADAEMYAATASQALFATAVGGGRNTLLVGPPGSGKTSALHMTEFELRESDRPVAYVSLAPAEDVGHATVAIYRAAAARGWLEADDDLVDAALRPEDPYAPNALIRQLASAPAEAVVLVDRNGMVAAGRVMIANVAPALFTANYGVGGVAAALAFRLKGNGAQSYEPVAAFDSVLERFVPVPIDLGPATDQVFLVLFGTGIRFRSSLGSVSATIGGLSSEVLAAQAVMGFVGLDQVNIRMSRALIGRGEVDVKLSVDGRAANTVQVKIR